MDFDPTEGLPVQKWQQIPVKINQDPPNELNGNVSGLAGTTATSSADWASQFGTPQFPWQERPLPSFFSQLAPWNQEMIRQARCGNTNPTLSQYDAKSNSWISAAELEKRKTAQNPAGTDTVMNTADTNAAENGTADPESPSTNDEHADEDIEDVDHEEQSQAHPTTPFKKRKMLAPEDRTFETKRWMQVPQAIAEKQDERKFLADRRPGMPSLYGGPYQNKVFGPLGLSQNGYSQYGSGSTSYDLGDGTGLGNAVGRAPADEQATPVRRNMPPKRKKKKGGPGRKKANPHSENSATNSAMTVAVDGNGDASIIGAGTSSQPQGEHDVKDDDQAQDGEGSEESEGEGSEEGEIDEHIQEAEEIANTATTSNTAPPTMMSIDPPPASPPASRTVSDTTVPALNDMAGTTTAIDAMSNLQQTADPGSIPATVIEPIVVPDVAVEEHASDPNPLPPQSDLTLEPSRPLVPESVLELSDQSSLAGSTKIPVADILAPPADPAVTNPTVQTTTDTSSDVPLEPVPTAARPSTPTEVSSDNFVAEPVAIADTGLTSSAEVPTGAQVSLPPITAVVPGPMAAVPVSPPRPSIAQPIDPQAEPLGHPAAESSTLPPLIPSEAASAAILAPAVAPEEPQEDKPNEPAALDTDLLGGLEESVNRDMAS